MNAYALSLPLLAWLAVVLSHLLLIRVFPDRHWGIILGATAVLGLCLIWGSLGGISATPSWGDRLAYLIFLGGCYGYFTLINLNITALRIRLLKILYLNPDPRVAEERIWVEYDPEWMLRARLTRLEKICQISNYNEDGQLYYRLRRWDLGHLRRWILRYRRFLGIRTLT